LKFKQTFTGLLICQAKPETQEETMQSAEQQKCQHHTGLYKHQRRPGPGKCAKPEQKRPQIMKGVLPQKHAVPNPILQLEMSELAQSSLLWWSLVMLQHKHTAPVSGLFNSILNLLKAPMVYLNKAAAGFYTVIAKARFLVRQYTFLCERRWVLPGYTC